MPAEVFGPDHVFLPWGQLLTFGEITHLTRTLMDFGIHKVRLTGGEPLLRPGIASLVADLAALGLRDLAMTTNGLLLPRHARELAGAGLGRVTISLDALDDAVFRAVNGVGTPVTKVLAGIEAALEAGLGPVKVNMVVQRGLNEGQILPMARHFRGSGCILRFIEYMDVGASNGWRPDRVVPAREILDLLRGEFELEPLEAAYRGEVATRWRHADGTGELGLIASVSQPFCGDCTRLRLSADGRLFTCLFASTGTDLRPLLRDTPDEEALLARLRDLWRGRGDRYSEQRRGDQPRDGRVEMSYIGG